METGPCTCPTRLNISPTSNPIKKNGAPTPNRFQRCQTLSIPYQRRQTDSDKILSVCNRSGNVFALTDTHADLDFRNGNIHKTFAFQGMHVCIYTTTERYY